MKDNPLDFKNKRDRNDLLIAIPVILFFAWLLFYFGWGRDTEEIREGMAINAPTLLVDDYDKDGISDDKDRCPREYGLPKDEGCPTDSDNDGILDHQDSCPNQKGSKRHYGCPADRNADSDGDGFLNHQDRCPNVVGTDRGCPADMDQDGIPNREDKCPRIKGVIENDGCPIERNRLEEYNKKRETTTVPAPPIQNDTRPIDSDGDGVLDKDDRCPNQKGIISNNGCPVKIKDSDKDGVPDNIDACPDEKGPATNKGCPVLEISKEDKVIIEEAISSVVFLPASSNLTEYSKALVKNIAQLMKKYPSAKLLISGHTDSIGEEASNLKLSQDRAKTCLDLIAAQGIDRTRLQSEGFGESKPIATNNTKEGRQKNRRVEFKLYR